MDDEKLLEALGKKNDDNAKEKGPDKKQKEHVDKPKKKHNMGKIFCALIAVSFIAGSITYALTKDKPNDLSVETPSITQFDPLVTASVEPTEKVEKEYTTHDLLKLDNSLFDSSYKDYMDYLRIVNNYEQLSYFDEAMVNSPVDANGNNATLDFNNFNHVFTNGKDSGEVVFDMHTMDEQLVLKDNTIKNEENEAVGCINMWKLNLAPEDHQDLNIISGHTDKYHTQFGNFYTKYSTKNDIVNNMMLIIDGNVVEARAILDVSKSRILDVIENTSIETFAKNNNLEYDKEKPNIETITAYNEYVNNFLEKCSNPADNEVNEYLGEFDYDVTQNGDLYFVNYCFNPGEKAARGAGNERMVLFEKVGVIDKKLINNVYNLYTDEDYSNVGISFENNKSNINDSKWTGNSNYIRFNKDGSITVENFESKNHIKKGKLIENMNSLFKADNPKLGSLNTGRTFV